MNIDNLDIIKFWKNVLVLSDNECWEWLAGKSGAGYGRISISGRVEYAHRVSYILFNGEMPSGTEVLHSCDNPSCVNPNHLEAGTHSKNISDAYARGRMFGPKGESSAVSKLTWVKVRAIRKMYSSGKYSHRKLGAIFGVSNRNISDITRRITWRENED